MTPGAPTELEPAAARREPTQTGNSTSRVPGISVVARVTSGQRGPMCDATHHRQHWRYCRATGTGHTAHTIRLPPRNKARTQEAPTPSFLESTLLSHIPVPYNGTPIFFSASRTGWNWMATTPAPATKPNLKRNLNSFFISPPSSFPFLGPRWAAKLSLLPIQRNASHGRRPGHSLWEGRAIRPGTIL